MVVQGHLKVMVPSAQEQLLTKEQIHRLIVANRDYFLEKPVVHRGPLEKPVWARGEPLGSLMKNTDSFSQSLSQITPSDPSTPCKSPLDASPRKSSVIEPKFPVSPDIANLRRTLAHAEKYEKPRSGGRLLGRSQTTFAPFHPMLKATKRFELEGL